MIEITVFHKNNGPLSKRIELDEDGKVFADGSACRMAEGDAWRVKLDGIASLAELIEHMPSEEALTLGSLRDDVEDKVKVILARDLNDKTKPNVIARTKVYLRFAPGESAYMLLDHDRKGQPREVAAKLKQLGGFWKAVLSAAPGLANVARVTRRSTSAGLYHRQTQEWLKGSAGWHIYVVVKDGSDIERATKDLHDRLWLNELGYPVVGIAGQVLDRSIIDTAVFSPERLVFEGKPVLVPPVGQDKEERRPIAYKGDIIDTMAVIPPLSDDERARVAQLKTEAKARLKPEATAARRKWAKKFAARKGLSEEEAEKIALNATEHHILHGEFELVFDELGKHTVAEVLATPEEYIEQSLADPLEGVAYGRGKAKVFKRPDGHLMINSYAHGGIKYRLAEQGIGLDDFWAYMRQHNYMYAPTRESWPASSVNACVPPAPLLDTNGQPVLDEQGRPRFIPASKWLDQHQRVIQLTWAPGLPMLIENRLIAEGGWITRNAVRCFNLYRPPNLKLGNADDVDPWYDHLKLLYPNDHDHIVCWLAQRVQRPQDKINHGLVLGGNQGTGKDTLLEPVRQAVGEWNCSEISPKVAMERFNNFAKSVILHIVEARDLGEFDRFAFYDHMKAYTAAPPNTLRVDEKYLPAHNILNCCGVILTTNNKNSLYLPADDRRYYVAWSERTKEEFHKDYFKDLWKWYENGGINNVAAYLAEVNIKDFDAKAPPPKTAAFWAIVDTGGAPEDAELADALDALATGDPPQLPKALTKEDIIRAAHSDDFKEWLSDRRNNRLIPHRMEACGYVPLRSPTEKDGRWRIAGKRAVIYVQKDLSQREQQEAAKKRAEQGDLGDESEQPERRSRRFRYRGSD